jgi:hypothetical protein
MKKSIRNVTLALFLMGAIAMPSLAAPTGCNPHPQSATTSLSKVAAAIFAVLGL